MLQQQQFQQNKAQKKQIENQKVQPMKQNPTVTSFSIPDDKPLSPMSMVRPTEKIHIFRKEFQTQIDTLKTLANYGEQDYTNGTFYGQMVNGKKHGKGIQIKRLKGLMLMEGRHCEGFWQNDRKHGVCREQFDNGAYFEGEYQNGKPQGQGVQWRQNESYEGQWVNGLRHGHGVWKLDNSFYEGEWRFGKIDGHGVYIHNKSKYTGSFKNSLKHGHGVENFANGDVYNGQYCNGNMEGQGTYIWANGEEYRGILEIKMKIGTFRNGVRHGNGVQLRWDNLKEGHIRYEGQYENDKKHGQGVFTWPSGNHYIGNFANNYRHGYGEMYWKDEYYKGQWERGMQHGEGELCRNGVLKKGKFENNILCNQRSHSMWEQGDQSFNLGKGNESFSGTASKTHKFMPSIGRKPKPIFEMEGRTVIMNNFMSVEVPIENDPDFLSVCPVQRTIRKKIHNKPKLSLLLQEHFKQGF